ncbi:hypothetical protein Y032_0050g1923 [Ancylostoma ceylanicum]|uniref:Secreted protein n=1 Tax=Ancylostoma ceylanicum TaxID=53326 RepID=A0A016U813_9BILA|nr:hypothetical protein Y032_0050g1923 [Ancylostoma ceylanicum]
MQPSGVAALSTLTIWRLVWLHPTTTCCWDGLSPDISIPSISSSSSFDCDMTLLVFGSIVRTWTCSYC